jgi:hypothetical protein
MKDFSTPLAATARLATGHKTSQAARARILTDGITTAPFFAHDIPQHVNESKATPARVSNLAGNVKDARNHPAHADYGVEDIDDDELSGRDFPSVILHLGRTCRASRWLMNEMLMVMGKYPLFRMKSYYPHMALPY